MTRPRQLPTAADLLDDPGPLPEEQASGHEHVTAQPPLPPRLSTEDAAIYATYHPNITEETTP